MNKRKTLELSTIELSDKVMVSDPCYKRGTWCHGTVDNVLPGTYRCIVTYSDELMWGERVSALTVFHESVQESEIKKGEKAPFTVGVDSGQAGIFCDSIYPHGETGDYGDMNSFYGVCCDATAGAGYESKQRIWSYQNDIKYHESVLADSSTSDFMKESSKLTIEFYKKKLAEHKDIPYTQSGTVFSKGVVSSSGFGDGSYAAYLYKKDGKVIGIRIFYL